MSLCTGLKHAEEAHTSKLQSGRAKQKTIFELAWNVEEHKILLQTCKALIERLKQIEDFMNARPTKTHCVQQNFAGQLSELRKQLPEFIKGVEMKHRQPATHALFFLISDERRAQKPYAVPVQYIAYSSMKDNDIRTLADKIKIEMVKLGMTVVGKVHNEYTNFSP